MLLIASPRVENGLELSCESYLLLEGKSFGLELGSLLFKFEARAA